MLIFSSLLAFFSTYFAIACLRQPASRWGLVDLPSARKKHQGAVPLIGGIAIYLGWLSAILISPLKFSDYQTLIFCGSLLIIMGLLDDLYDLAVKIRLVVQFLVLLLMAYQGQIVIHTLSTIFGHVISCGSGSIIITILVANALINAFNMTDGLDGLAGSLAFIQALVLFIAFAKIHFFVEAEILVLLMLSLIAFLCFNFPLHQAKRRLIFMGNSGSMLLGLVLVWFTIQLTQTPQLSRPVTLVWIMALPIWDFMLIVSKRLLAGKSPFIADRLHFHYVLFDYGLSINKILMLMSSIAFITGMSGIIADWLLIPEELMLIAWLGLGTIYFYANYLLIKKRRISNELQIN